MTVDIERVLRRVVDDVFGDAVAVEFRPHLKDPYDVRAIATGPDARVAVVRATYEWFTVHLPAYGVGTIDFAYDEDEHEKEMVLRGMALLAREYLQGRWHLVHKPSMIRRRPRPFVVIESERRRWELGRTSGRVVEIG